MAEELDFLGFLKQAGIDPETLLSLQERTKGKTTPSDLSSEAPVDTATQVENLLKETLGTVGGKGLDDDVPAVIDGQDPAALSAGEYVIPADVVSMLGDGNTEAGSNVLKTLIDKIRALKTGTTEQAPPVEDLLALTEGQ